MVKRLSLATSIFALLFFTTPLLNLVILASDLGSLFWFGGVLFGIWLALILLSFYLSRHSHAFHDDYHREDIS